MDVHTPPRGPDYIQSLVRGLAVLRSFSGEHSARTLSQIAQDTGLARAVVRRSLLTFQHLGYVAEAGGRFYLRPRVLELGYAHLSGMSLKEVAEQHLEALSQEVHASASMCVLDGEDVVYIARVPTSQIMTISINLGTRFPAYATSMGKVLLAGLSDAQLERYLSAVQLRALTPRTVTDKDVLRAELLQVRQQGWVIVDQELEEGLRAIAAPVRTRSGRTMAAVNVSAHASQADISAMRRDLLPPLLAGVARIEAELEGHPGPDIGISLTS